MVSRTHQGLFPAGASFGQVLREEQGKAYKMGRLGNLDNSPFSLRAIMLNSSLLLDCFLFLASASVFPTCKVGTVRPGPCPARLS